VPKENTEDTDDDNGVKHLIYVGGQPEKPVKESEVKGY
jgi:hypothetical protein